MTIYTLLSVASVVMTLPMSPTYLPEADHLNSYPAPMPIEALPSQYYNSFDHRGSGR